jgi:hypothetical protein
MLMELWLGPANMGSLFSTRAELQEAWREHREEVMLPAKPGTRPVCWYEIERPDVVFSNERERSTLWLCWRFGRRREARS